MPSTSAVGMKEFVDSAQWEEFLNRVIAKEAHGLWHKLKELTPETAGDGPIYAVQLRLLERILRDTYELAEVRDESERAMHELNQMRGEIGNG